MVRQTDNSAQPHAVATVINADASSSALLICEHASNFIPPQFDGLGIDEAVQQSHVAWDPGAADVAQHLSRLLNAALVKSEVSRLVYDCNRPPEEPSAIPAKSEIFSVPGNENLSDAQRADRVATYYHPFHQTVATTIEAMKSPPVIITVHSFTPVYFDTAREVQLGILHDGDSRLADLILKHAPAHTDLITRRNEPYGPGDGVLHTLRKHGIENGFANVMLEIRNDLIATPDQCRTMAQMLADLLGAAMDGLRSNAEPQDIAS